MAENLVDNIVVEGPIGFDFGRISCRLLKKYFLLFVLTQSVALLAASLVYQSKPKIYPYRQTFEFASVGGQLVIQSEEALDAANRIAEDFTSSHSDFALESATTSEVHTRKLDLKVRSAHRDDAESFFRSVLASLNKRVEIQIQKLIKETEKSVSTSRNRISYYKNLQHKIVHLVEGNKLDPNTALLFAYHERILEQDIEQRENYIAQQEKLIDPSSNHLFAVTLSQMTPRTPVSAKLLPMLVLASLLAFGVLTGMVLIREKLI